VGEEWVSRPSRNRELACVHACACIRHQNLTTRRSDVVAPASDPDTGRDLSDPTHSTLTRPRWVSRRHGSLEASSNRLNSALHKLHFDFPRKFTGVSFEGHRLSAFRTRESEGRVCCRAPRLEFLPAVCFRIQIGSGRHTLPRACT